VAQAAHGGAVLKLERHRDHLRVIGGPVPPGAAAITIGSVISVRARAAGDERLLRHELVHVEQWRRLGFVGFVRRYLGSYLGWRLRGHSHRDAYRHIGLEVEAEWRARAGPPAGAGTVR
jgi:hypothetical protein